MANGRAIIPEPRNDENLIIVRFQKAIDRYPPIRLDQGSTDVEGPPQPPATSEAWQVEHPPAYGQQAERG